jgi:hypothetical protein
VLILVNRAFFVQLLSLPQATVVAMAVALREATAVVRNTHFSSIYIKHLHHTYASFDHTL